MTLRRNLSLPSYIANYAVTNGFGVYMDGEPQPGPSRAELERQEEKIAAGTLTQVGEETSQPEPEEVKKPYGNAPKSAWVRYAAAVDENMSEERAEGLTKADLMSRYGERL